MEHRISKAALLRILLPFAEMAKDINDCDPLKLVDTLNAVYNYVLDPDFVPAGDDLNDYSLDQEMYEKMKAEIDASARRCAMARERARRRKESREAKLAKSVEPVSDSNIKPSEAVDEKSQPNYNRNKPVNIDNQVAQFLHRHSIPTGAVAGRRDVECEINVSCGGD